LLQSSADLTLERRRESCSSPASKRLAQLPIEARGGAAPGSPAAGKAPACSGVQQEVDITDCFQARRVQHAPVETLREKIGEAVVSSKSVLTLTGPAYCSQLYA